MECSWFNCKEDAEYKVKRANAAFCEHHLQLNALRFGCAEIITKAEPIEHQTNEEK